MIRLGFLMLCLSFVSAAHADLYKCVDAEGRVTYTQTKDPKAKCTVPGGNVMVVPFPTPSAPKPTAAPEVKTRQRDLLQQQIAEKEKALAEAKKALEEQENIRLGGERNYQRVLDRLKPYQDKVAEIEKQLADLRAEQAKSP